MPPQEHPDTVLHVCAGNQFGGVESMLVCLAREPSTRQRFQPTFACCFEGRFSQELRRTQAPVHLLPGVRLSRPWGILQARHALRQLLTRSKPAVVVTHSAWTRLVFGRSLARSGTPTVVWIHGASSPLSRLDRWAQRPAPALVLLNSRHTGDLTRSLFPGAPREILFCPVPRPAPSDPNSRRSLRESLGAAPDQTVLLIAARLEPWKGHELLLNALACLPKSPSPNWACWIAGGPQTPEQRTHLEALVQRARHLGLHRQISFLGERRDVPQLMNAADVYCQPNLGPEPFGVVFVEALYAGLPVVSTALGGAQEIIQESCGRQVPPGDPAALAQTLGSLIADPELRAQLGSRGPARATELCDPSARVRDLERHLTRVCKRS